MSVSSLPHYKNHENYVKNVESDKQNDLDKEVDNTGMDFT